MSKKTRDAFLIFGGFLLGDMIFNEGRITYSFVEALDNIAKGRRFKSLKDSA